jgi:uncharacterized protein YegL
MAAVNLIVSEERVSILAGQPKRSPSVAVVYADHNGGLHLIGDGQPSGWWDQVRSQYKTRFEVDLRDHERQVELRSNAPRAAGGVYSFETSLTVAFRVWEPRLVVRRGLIDALVPVYSYIEHTCRDLAANFEIEQSRDVELAIDRHFAQPIRLPEGIEIYRVRPRVAPDQAARAYLSTIDDVRRKRLIGTETHQTARGEALGDNEIAAIRQDGALERRQREHAALEGRPVDMVDMVKIMLEREPENVAGATELLLKIAEAHDARRQQHEANVRKVLDVQAAESLLRRDDIDGYLGRLSGGTTPAIAPPPSADTNWDRPIPGEGTPPPPRQPTVVAPVYLAIDESPVDGLSALEAALQRVYDALANAPELAAALRLSVLGFADGTQARRWLETVDQATIAPSLRPGGPARYGALCDFLRGRLPLDVEDLKSAGHRVARPLVMVVTTGQPDDEGAWREAHARLVDRADNRGAPDIVAVGVGGAPAETIAALASRPDYAFVATTPDHAEAAARAGDFLRVHVLRYGKAIVDGDHMPYFQAPEGFRRASEVH